MTVVQLRQETAADYDAVYNVNKLAFNGLDEADLVNRLRTSEAFVPELSLVAVENSTVVGYILFTKVTIGSYISLALAPLAVHPDCQKKGIGKLLVNEGHSRAKQLGYKSVIVLGHEHYYPKFGYLPATEWNIHSCFNAPVTHFRALELVPNGLENVSGEVIYAKEFFT
ncbi:acyl-CoA N-acyltransferase, partial [Basidiobolus meristosporus CBS 931.73]